MVDNASDCARSGGRHCSGGRVTEEMTEGMTEEIIEAQKRAITHNLMGYNTSHILEIWNFRDEGWIWVNAVGI